MSWDAMPSGRYALCIHLQRPLRPNGILTDWEAEDFKVEEIEKALASFPQAGVPASQDY